MMSIAKDELDTGAPAAVVQAADRIYLTEAKEDVGGVQRRASNPHAAAASALLVHPRRFDSHRDRVPAPASHPRPTRQHA